MVILGTQYAGEMKKGIFTVMHYFMPKRGILSLHSGCNVGAASDVSLFFGLSGAPTRDAYAGACAFAGFVGFKGRRCSHCACLQAGHQSLRRKTVCCPVHTCGFWAKLTCFTLYQARARRRCPRTRRGR